MVALLHATSVVLLDIFSYDQKCYDAMVQSTLNYGAPIYGTSAFSCIDAVQNRACRYFLGLGKYAPNTVINGDRDWSIHSKNSGFVLLGTGAN